MARWNRAVGGVRSYAKRLRPPKPVRQAPVSAAPSMAPAQIEALKTFGFPVPAGCEPLVAPKPPRAALKPVTRVTDATARPDDVDVRFSDGHEYRFHNMWLRDACRDRTHVLSSQERCARAEARGRGGLCRRGGTGGDAGDFPHPFPRGAHGHKDGEKTGNRQRYLFFPARFL